jgi:hypothetical protein
MIKAEHEITLSIHVNPEDAWKIIGSGKDVNKWFPEMIKTCELKDNKRVCGTDKGNIIEEILKIDNENREFKYAFLEQTIFPNATNIVGYMKVLSNNEKTLINWKWKFDTENISSSIETKQGLQQAGEMGIKGIEKYIKTLDM